MPSAMVPTTASVNPMTAPTAMGRDCTNTFAAAFRDLYQNNLVTATELSKAQAGLYELRMAYVEVTNAISRPPQGPFPGAPSGKK